MDILLFIGVIVIGLGISELIWSKVFDTIDIYVRFIKNKKKDTTKPKN